LLSERDTEAIRLIDRHYQTALVGVIYRIVQSEAFAEDVWQESLVKIWRFADQFDPKKGRLFTWLINICRRAAIDKTRSRAFKERSGGPSTSSNSEETPRREASETPYVEGIGVRDIVQKLEPKYSELIDLAFFQGYTHQEAAEALDLPLGTVKTRIRKAVNVLREWMGN
ncbi:MAG: sigma-70 family RNA polymerase sigma factor, partial [Bacteroidota bacterium]